MYPKSMYEYESLKGNSMKEVTDATFKAEILNAKKPVLVKFGAEWCGPCRMLAPILEEVLAVESANFDIVSVDVDNSPEISANYGIQSLPTMILFKDGENVAQFMGMMQKEDVISRVKEAL
jgi:thioredoxin 1